MTGENDKQKVCWYAMRDLSRRHAKSPAYKLLTEMGFEIFTPMTRRLTLRNGRRISKEEPFMQDLLFVHDSRERLNPAVAKIERLQYRYIHGGYCEPMVVPDADMARFIHAVRSSRLPRFFRPEEITADMCGQYVRIVGGNLDGYEGHLLSIRGSKFKRLMVTLPNFMTAAVEVQLDLIEVLE
ncbi:MAG: UpxY family transcription antiterminator [Alistipes sp.]|nr:UpxY family transcription antiterminator [Alistipes sp.]